MWLQEISPCCCLTSAGKTRQLLLNNIYRGCIEGQPNFLKEGQIARVLGRKEGQFESNFVLRSYCVHQKLNAWQLRTDEHSQQCCMRSHKNLNVEGFSSFHHIEATDMAIWIHLEDIWAAGGSFPLLRLYFTLIFMAGMLWKGVPGPLEDKRWFFLDLPPFRWNVKFKRARTTPEWCVYLCH